MTENRECREELVAGWANGEAAARQDVKALLRQAGLDQEAIAAQTLADKLDTIEKLDRMIMQTEARRNAILREVDRRREALGAAAARSFRRDRGRRIHRNVSAATGRRGVRPSARTRANRRNARASTGPTTPAGKARVAKNALRHGLAVAAGLRARPRRRD